MSRKKHVLPSTLPSREGAAYERLVVRPGPWEAPQWAVMAHSGAVRSSPGTCVVEGCGRDWYLQPSKVLLCYPHWWQWKRDSRPADVAAWARTEARPPQIRVRSNSVTDAVIDFTTLPPLVALEIRYVVAAKITSGDWTPNAALRNLLRDLTDDVRANGCLSLLDKRPEDWVLRLRDRAKTPSGKSLVEPYLRTFFATLHRALVVDPWAEEKWLWAGMFDQLIHGQSHSASGSNIDWSGVKQDWLRAPLRTYARQCLTTGTRSWSTVVGWASAARNLSGYLTAEGVDDPAMVDRAMFIDYVNALNEAGASTNRMAGVNTIARVLSDIHTEGLAEFGSAVFLRYGENVIEKKQRPKPYPADIVERVDREILNDPLLERSARMMLQLTRWGGLRISELVACPLDLLRHNGTRGYWIHYYMPKTRSWRSFPVPDDLARALLGHQAWVRETYGRDTECMFPSPTRSSEEHQSARPWTPEGFRNHIRASFERLGIHTSSITGEKITGGEIHRYRHTIGTALLNAGWSQREVQEFLGHESAQMTANYAEILDDTLIRKVREFEEQSTTSSPAELTSHPGVERMRARFAYELPDGGCTLPANQSCDTRDNPCSGCAFFESGGADIRPVHEQRRKRLKLHLEQDLDPRERSLNERALKDVERILDEAN